MSALALGGAAQAQEREPDLERARALFDEAGELELAGKWAAAQDRLRAAIRIRETANLRYALGWALENDGKQAAARREYETARQLAERTDNDEVRELAATRIGEIDRRSAPNVASTSPARATKRDSAPVVPWVLVGGGGALILTGTMLFVSSSSDASTRDEDTSKWCEATACSGGVATKPETTEAAALRREAYDAASRGNTKQIIGGVLGGVGAVGVGVGVFMLLRNRASEQALRAGRVTVDAAPLRGGGVAAATIAF